MGPTASPNNHRTGRPTQSPPSPPTGPPLVLTSEIDGQYQIAGSIVIDTVPGFENGGVVQRPRLFLDIPNLVDAPGPYLYLSKRPYSETKGGNLDDEDIFIPIDSAADGKFNVNGRFDQFLDEINDVSDLNEYANGSW